MRLTNYSDFALRTLMYLAVVPKNGALANISDIADSYHISKSHLTKVVHQLGKLGYIDSIRGKGGGIRLAKAPETINLGILIRQIEPDFELVECFGKSATIKSELIYQEGIGCVISPDCQLKGVFSEALSAFITVLERYTLADIIQNDAKLTALLS